MHPIDPRAFGEIIDQARAAVVRDFVDRAREQIPAARRVSRQVVEDHLHGVLGEIAAYLRLAGTDEAHRNDARLAAEHGRQRAQHDEYTLAEVQLELRILHGLLAELVPPERILDAEANRLFTEIFVLVSPRTVELFVRNSGGELRARERERTIAEEQIGRLRLQRHALEVERANFENFFREMPELVAIFEGQDHFVDFANRAFAKILEGDAGAGPLGRLLDGADALIKTLDEVYATGTARGVSELKLIVRGQPRYYSFTFSARLNACDEIVGVMALGFDVTARVLARESDQLQQQALELALGTAPLERVLENLARMVELRIGDGLLASILLVDETGRSLSRGVAPSLPAELREAVLGCPVEEGRGTCGTAAARRERVISTDLSRDPHWDCHRDLVERFDLRACWSTPIFDGAGTLLGTFAFFSPTARGPGARELRIVDIVTRTTALILANRNAAERASVTSRRAQTAERMLQKAVDVAKIGFFDWDLKTDVVTVSDQFTRDWGLENGIRGDQVFAVILPEDLPALRKTIADAAADGLTHHAQYRIRRRRDDAVIWIEAQGRATMDERGRPLRIFGTSVDVTARKERESETLAMVNSIPQLAWMGDANGHLFWYNQRWQDFTGADQARMAEVGWSPFHHPDHLERATRKWLAHVAEGKRWEDIFPLRGRDGEYRTFLSRAEPIRDVQGRIVRWFGTNTDVTEPLRAKRNLAQLAAIVESSADFIGLADENFKLKFVNRAARAMVGFGDRDVTAMRLGDFVADDERVHVVRQAIPRLRNDQSWQGELNLRHFETGAPIPVTYTVFPIKDTATGELLGFATVARDVTERREYEAELRRAKDDAEQANHAKSAFLANMSHEIRTPLGAIMGFADLAQQPGTSVDDVRKYLNVVERNSTQVLRIIDDILDLAKVEAGRIELEHLEFALTDFLADFASLMGFRARENGIEFRLVADGDVPSAIVSDPTRLRQILTNAVGNAIKFTTKGSVELHVETAGQHLVFRIVDTGRGISREQIGSLFQPFAQADASTTRKFGGTGLGLVLTRRLCQLMGGDYVLERSQLNEGSMFTASVRLEMPAEVRLIPRGEVEFELSGRTKTTAAAGRLEGVSILLVEDSLDNQFLIRLLLERQGAKVEIEGDGRRGSDRALAEHFDVVLMDIQMPVMDGHEAMRRLRAAHFARPVIALTAHAMKEEAARTKASGFTDLLTKPIQREALVALVGAYARAIRR